MLHKILNEFVRRETLETKIGEKKAGRSKPDILYGFKSKEIET
jgi:hypothetical protein